MSKKHKKTTKKSATQRRKARKRDKSAQRGSSAGRLKPWLIGLLLLALATVVLNWVLTRKPDFDGNRAYQQLLAQCDFGPRAPGSEGHRRCGDYLVAELRRYADRVGEQKFTYQDKKQPGKSYDGRNIIASFRPDQSRRIMLAAHWDTRPFADNDPDSEKRHLPIIGANDGASGVAVLLEMARIFHQKAPAANDIGIDIVFFDLEDIGDSSATEHSDSLNPYSIGSEYFAANLQGYRPAFGILLDMVGEKNLEIRQEGFSLQQARFYVDKIWKAAEAIDSGVFLSESEVPIMDDHVPFLKRQISFVNLIDFRYPYWHTLADTPDKCSPQSLEAVGEVLVELFYNDDYW